MEPSAQVVLIPGVTTSASKEPFNVDKMEVAGLPVRRVASMWNAGLRKGLARDWSLTSRRGTGPVAMMVHTSGS